MKSIFSNVAVNCSKSIDENLDRYEDYVLDEEYCDGEEGKMYCDVGEGEM